MEIVAMQLGKLGVWAAMDVMSAADGAAFAQRVEGWGYAALWLPESRGRNVLVHSSWLLANTKALIVAPGIANIYARDPMAMANGQRALAEQSGGRFLLGLGVSHVPSVEGVRGHTYGRPVATMRAYLEAMHAAPYGAPEPAEKPLTILAALGPRMMALSSSHADGSHPYNVTPEHTAESRRMLRWAANGPCRDRAAPCPRLRPFRQRRLAQHAQRGHRAERPGLARPVQEPSGLRAHACRHADLRTRRAHRSLDARHAGRSPSRMASCSGVARPSASASTYMSNCQGATLSAAANGFTGALVRGSAPAVNRGHRPRLRKTCTTA
jgi:alkanesulfonate monooxygenase SsuD/methylene tetrahydromethanopterin reductase-like flavin-dependent oxidoreductase (luciferase family)